MNDTLSRLRAVLDEQALSSNERYQLLSLTARMSDPEVILDAVEQCGVDLSRALLTTYRIKRRAVTGLEPILVQRIIAVERELLDLQIPQHGSTTPH